MKIFHAAAKLDAGADENMISIFIGLNIYGVVLSGRFRTRVTRTF